MMAGLVSAATFGDIHRGVGGRDQLAQQFDAVTGPASGVDAGGANAGGNSEG